MTEAVSVQLIATAGVVLAAVIGLAATAITVYAGRISRRVKAIGVQASAIHRQAAAIQGQVQNDHDSNLREDLDGKHDENQKILLTIQRDVAWLMRRQADTDDRLDVIEETTEGRKIHREQPQPWTPIDAGGIPGVTRRQLRTARVPSVPRG